MRARSDLTGLLCVVHAWAGDRRRMALYAMWPNPLTFIAAVILIGSRQLGLAILMHDAAHGVLVNSRWLNDPLSQWLCAWPVFTDTIPYRHYHLVHHRTTQQPDDPDLHLSAKFPITRASYRRKFLRDITGQTGFKLRRSQIRNALGKPGTGFAARFADLPQAHGQDGAGQCRPAGDPDGLRQAALLSDVLDPAADHLAAGGHPHPQHRRTRDGAGQ